jgi:tripartite-type tricarboxylate transporter receptor subunit TctC
MSLPLPRPLQPPGSGTTRRNLMRCLLGPATLMAIGAPALAADEVWPTRRLTMVVPYAAGGPADSLARKLASVLESSLVQTVIVDNKGGGAATIGTGFVARAQPDGYTLLIGTSAGHVVTPLMQKTAYDGVGDFEFIGVVASQPNVLVARADFSASSLAEVITLAKRSPDGLTFASAGLGGATHLGGVALQQRAGIKLTHIPYAGAAPAMKDLLGGQVQLGVLNLGAVLPFVKDGRLKAIAYAAPKRTELLPAVPTIAESGFTGAESATWYTLAVPKGTPAAVKQKLHGALNAALADASFVQFLGAQGAERMLLTMPAADAFVREDQKQMRHLLGTIGLLQLP